MRAQVFRILPGSRWLSAGTLLVLATVLAVLLAVLGAASAGAEPTPPAGPNPPGGNAPTAAGAVTGAAEIDQEVFPGPPPACPTSAPANAVGARAIDWVRLCQDAVALAPTYEAERAIKWGFARLGASYNVTYRATTAFDCSSFVGRAFRAGGSVIAARNGVRYPFFPYFGYTGAYVPSTSPISKWGGGYDGTNLVRVQRQDLRPGDLIIQFRGTDPGNSQGNAGHAQIYLSPTKVLEAGGSHPDHVDVGPMANFIGSEWYFRYQSLGTEKPGYSTQLPPGTYKMQVGQPNETVIGNLTVAAPATEGHTRVFTCGTPMPEASNTSFVAGRSTATAAAVRLDGGGNVCIYLSTRAHMIWDQLWASSNIRWGTTDALVAHAPERKLDTRKSGRLAAGAIQVIGTGAPDQTIMATVTVVRPVGVGHTQVFPCDVDGTPGIDALPGASTNNFANARTANLATVRSDANGDVCVYTSGEMDLLWDQVVESSQVKAAPPVRMYDSRLPAGSPIPNNAGARLDPNDPQKVVRIATGTPNGTVIGNLTTTDALTAAHVKVVQCSYPVEPDTSVLNFPVRQTVSNAVVAQADFNGEVCFKVKDWTHLIWDQVVVSDQLGFGNTIERKMDSREPYKRPALIA